MPWRLVNVLIFWVLPTWVFVGFLVLFQWCWLGVGKDRSQDPENLNVDAIEMNVPAVPTVGVGR